MKTEQLQEMKARLNKTTDTIWRTNMHNEILTSNGVRLGQMIRVQDAEFLIHAREDVPALIEEIERLQQALAIIAHTPKFKQQNEVERYAELALEGREGEWAESPFPSEIEVYRKALDRKIEVHEALNKDYVKVRNENERLRAGLEKIKNVELGRKSTHEAVEMMRIASRVLDGDRA